MSFTTRIGTCFKALRKAGEKGFIAYITAGDPDLDGTVEMVLRLADAGVDIVELGLPFSDPLADGRVNQEASERALAAGATFRGVLGAVENIRRKSDIPILFFSYLNPLVSRGFAKSARMSAQAGVDGMLLLDLPVEEAGPYHTALHEHRLDNITLVTPTTPDPRIERIVCSATGFVYCVSRTGVTGMQQKTEKSARTLIRHTQKLTSLPVALGFGISTPEQAAEAARYADAVVVGSAIVKRFHEAAHTSAGRKKTAAWVGKMVHAVRKV